MLSSPLLSMHLTTTLEGNTGTHEGAVMSTTSATYGVTSTIFKGAYLGGVTSTRIQARKICINYNLNKTGNANACSPVLAASISLVPKAVLLTNAT